MPRPIWFATRQSINFRIPRELIERIDELRKRDKRDRTAVVVDALQRYLAAAERKRGES